MNRDEIIEYIAGRRVVASISGGKDSGAMSLYLTELGIEHERVHMPTGWEWDGFYDYLRGELTRVIGPILELEVPLQMEALAVKKGMFPSKRRRFCTEELKVFPMQRYIKSLVEAGHDCINAVGIRNAESEARSKASEWEWSEGFDCEVWRPIVKWSLDDVVAIHQRHGLAPNPLYLMGASRVGCWPCIYARKSEIRLIADKDPARIDRLRDLEKTVGDKAQSRYVTRLRVFQEGGSDALSARDRTALLDDAGKPKPFQRPSWFQAPIGGGGETWTIDRVVEWSRTLRGGRVEDRQEELFAQADEGCMRWGLCDTSPESA
jgi:3'-phosphoadenosine 5'-phosphosulfate sulfotransferase (PAPS reductase)/FAD synthetase